MERDSDGETPPLTIKLFGAMDARVNGLSLPKLRSRKELWLLALLALRGGKPVKRAWLAQELWPFPDHAVDQAAYNLRRGLTNLRKALGTQSFRLHSPTPDSLCLAIENASVDVAEWDALCARSDAASLELALACYTGPLLKECTESWALAEREAREQQYLQVLQARSAMAMAANEWETAVRCLRRVMEVDPLRESALRGLMEALAQSGNVYAALQTYQEFSLKLHRERNALPGQEITTLYQQLRTKLRDKPRPVSETKNETPVETSGTREAEAEPASLEPASLTPASPDTAVIETAALIIASSDTATTKTSALEFPNSPRLRRLPVPLTALIGREKEMEAILARLSQARLLTLAGAGGIGKTRLAIQLAEELSGNFSDGACFVDLSALTDGAQIAQMMAAMLGVSEAPDRPLLQTLQEFLNDKQLLLILDNCEHLIETCADLAESLLQQCRALRILATSRQPLDVQGESVWRVASLTLPDANLTPIDRASLADFLHSYAAIQLFVERATQAQADFVLTPQNAPAVIQICRQLDGIPLALELAAARVKALPVEQIAARLNDRFQLLTNGPRTALSRQRTLEAAMKWSFDLLSSEDRAMLHILSLFVGGWTLEAAEATWQGTGNREQGTEEKKRRREEEKTEEQELGNREQGTGGTQSAIGNRQLTIDGLSRLVDRSLVIYEQEGGEARYRLLETVRQYSRQELENEAGAQEARERHLDYYLRLAEEAHPNLQGKQQAWWLNWLEREHDNLRAALEWSLAQPETAERGLQMASALWRFWHKRGYLSLGRQILANVLERTRPLGNTPTRAEALNGVGMLACFQGDHATAQAYFEESLSVGNERDDPAIRANALHSLGQMAWNRHDYAQARVYFAQALAIHREHAGATQVAVTLNYLGVVASDEGDHEAAQRHFEEGLAIGTELGDKSLIAGALHGLAHRAFYRKNFSDARRLYAEELALARSLHDRELTAKTLHRLGCVEHELRNYNAARILFEESLTLARELSYRDLLSAVLYSLGKTASAQQDYSYARRCFEERLTISVQSGDKPGLFYTLDAVAAMFAVQGQERRAVLLFAVAQTLRESLLMPMPPENVAETPRLLAARAALGEEEFTQVWEQGRALTLEEAIEQAMQ